jgi:hypothetical protein
VQANNPSSLISLPKGSAPSAITEKLSDKERKSMEESIRKNQQAMREQKDPVKNILNFAQISLQQSQLDSYELDGTPKLLAMGVREKIRTADSPVYNRGEPEQPGKTVPRAMPQVMTDQQPAIRRGSSGRLELANWIASADNPLTARVMVNRVWLHLFGKGIVPTADNFGAAGLPPTNQPLLDTLAVQFVKSQKWSIKSLIRSLVTTRTYRLSSTYNASNDAIDPDHVRLWRSAPRRLDAESIRDAMLAISGQLEKTPPVGSPVAKAGEGPSIRPRLPSSLKVDPNDPHRTVYTPIIRDNLPDALQLFDAADPNLVTAERATTTVPAQSLYLMNNPFVQKASEKTASRLIEKTSAESDRIREAYLLVFGRPPSGDEMRTAEKFLKEYRSKAGNPPAPPGRFGRPGLPGTARPTEKSTWSAFVQALFSSAEFLYRN